MEYLGYSNSWMDAPVIVKSCKELGHEVNISQQAKCVCRYRCDVCGYHYDLDSGD